MNLLAAAANSAWAISNLPAWWAFRRSLLNPKAAQEKVLRAILIRAAQTDFGREHDFASIKTYEDFCTRVPLRDYGELEPLIDRVRRGDQRVLTGERVTRLATTGGTSGAQKLIPYTPALQAEFNRAIAPWIVDLFLSCPSLIAGPAYWSISPVARTPNSDASVPIGFEDDSEYLGGLRRRLVDAVMAVPSSVRHAPSIEEWRRQTIHHLVLCRDLRLISVWHPSFLTLLLDHLPAPPSEIWPELRAVSCWTDGHSELASKELGNRLLGVTIQPKGLIATEGIVSIPFRGKWPLAIRSHFLEFVAHDGVVLRSHELIQGNAYEVCLTTSGGLYRYRLNDVILVDGFVGQTPSVRFIGKSRHISDLFGEKLSEVFVGQVLRTLKAKLTADWTFAMLAPDGNAYTLFIEGTSPPQLACLLDDALRANSQYAYCRDLGQLTTPRIFRISTSAANAFASRLTSAHQRFGDIKPTGLSSLHGWDQHFAGQYLE